MAHSTKRNSGSVATRKRRQTKADQPVATVHSGTIIRPLTATALKQALWETLNAVKDGGMQAGQGDAVAAQGRELLRTVKTQLQVATQAGRKIPREVIEFSEN